MTICHRNFAITCSVAAVLLLGGCGKSRPGPSDDQIIGQINQQMLADIGAEQDSSPFDVSSLKVVAVEETGSSVEPEVEGRFIAKVKFQEDLFVVDDVVSKNFGFEDDVSVLSASTEKGDTNEITGIYRATSNAITSDGVSWSLDLIFDGEPPHLISGRPISEFETFVVSGSAEHKELMKAVNQATEKRQKFHQSLAGNWLSTGPLMSGQGSAFYIPQRTPNPNGISLPWVDRECEKPFGAGLKINIPDNLEMTKSVSGETFWVEDASRTSQFSGTLSIDEDYQGFVVIPNYGNKGVSCPVTANRRISMFPDGERSFRAEGIREGYFELIATQDVLLGRGSNAVQLKGSNIKMEKQ